MNIVADFHNFFFNLFYTNFKLFNYQFDEDKKEIHLSNFVIPIDKKRPSSIKIELNKKTTNLGERPMNIVADFHNFFFNLFYGSSENLWIALMKLRLYSLGLYVKHRE